MTTISQDQQRELLALVAWTQTFPEFGLLLYNGNDNLENVNRLQNSLCTIEAARAVAVVADIVCRNSSNKNRDNNSEQLWTSLLIETSSLARPLPKEPRSNGRDNRVTPTRLKIIVLGNLLDCAVQSLDLQKRRMYIERIMGLSKSIQKTLMALIERRGPKRVLSSHSPIISNLSQDDNIPMTPPSSLQRTNSNTTRHSSIPRLTPPHPSSDSKILNRPEESQRHRVSKMPSPLSKSASRVRIGMSALVGKIQQSHNNNEDDDTQTNSSSTTECASNRSSQASKEASRVQDKPVRLFPSALSPKKNTTPQRKRGISEKFMATPQEAVPFLSPGMMDSPTRLAEKVLEVTTKNDELQRMIETMKSREKDQSQKMEEMESDFRSQVMRLEMSGLDQLNEFQKESEERIESLTKELESTRTKAKEGISALHELKLARDELEVLSHGKGVLIETTEKLNKYKEKVCELQDVKEALDREREAHSKAVEEIVHLENALQATAPLKRQLESYKIRAVEAEVKLVECQDYLQQLEMQVDEENSKCRYLRSDAVMKKDQLEEMQRRIEQETQDIQNSSVSGVGDGISEMNPEMNQELIRLRGENLQLRAFAAKRNNDVVQMLEETVEDKTRLVERYKREFLSTKETLAETNAMLAESREKENKLLHEVAGLSQRLEQSDDQCNYLDQQLLECEGEIEHNKKVIQKLTDEKSSLSRELNALQQKTRDVETTSNERMDRLNVVINDLEETTNSLRATEELVQELRDDIRKHQKNADDDAHQLQQNKRRNVQLSDELNQIKMQLEDSEKHVENLDAQIRILLEEQTTLQKNLKMESDQHQVEAEEAQRSLEATREVLEAKHKKEQEELQANMSQLLENERRASRQKDEESKNSLREILFEWQTKYEKLESSTSKLIKQLTEDSKSREEQLVKGHQDQLTKERKEGNETHDRLIRKGKAMLEEAKSKAKDEIRRLDNLVKELDERNLQLKNERNEIETQLNNKVAALSHKLKETTGQVNSMSVEADELQDQILSLQRENYKLQEDCDRFRRQLGGRYGADGKVQSTLENLQLEYNAVLEENRKLKAETKEANRGSLYFDNDTNCDNSNSYPRGGGMNGATLTQLRREYEETIEALNDEKRELIMRNSAAITDVQKAEQRAWEREQEVSKLKAKITSLNLQIQRDALSRDLDTDTNAEHTQDFLGTPSKSEKPQQSRGYEKESYMTYMTRQDRSPGIERAMKHRAAQERALRTRFSSLTGLSPSKSIAELNEEPYEATFATSKPTTEKSPEEKETDNPDDRNDLDMRTLDKPVDDDDITGHDNRESDDNNLHETKEQDQMLSVISESIHSKNSSFDHDPCDIGMSVSNATSSSSLTPRGSSHMSQAENLSCKSKDMEWSTHKSDHSESKSKGMDWSAHNASVATDGISKSNSSLSSRSSILGSINNITNVRILEMNRGTDLDLVGKKTVTVSQQEGTISTITVSKKFEGRFDRWTKGSTNTSFNDHKTTDGGSRWKESPLQQKRDDSASIHNQSEGSSASKSLRKSAGIQKVASVFEAKNKKGLSPTKPVSFPTYSTPGKVGNNRKENGNQGKSFSSGIPSLKQSPSPNSSAFKMASAVFEVPTKKDAVGVLSPVKSFPRNQVSSFLPSRMNSSSLRTQQQSPNDSRNSMYTASSNTPKKITNLYEQNLMRSGKQSPSIVDVTQLKQNPKNANEERSDCKQS